MSKLTKIGIIDYGAGNLRSVFKAFMHVSNSQSSTVSVELISDAQRINSVSHLVLPGVGAFADCAEGLWKLEGMWDGLNEAVLKQGKPFLGICVGTQLMGIAGHEYKHTKGFGWIEGEVKGLEVDNPLLKIPHMGWNTLNVNTPHPLIKDIPLGEEGLHAYFVHSYAMQMHKGYDNQVIATTEYGGKINAIIGRDNMIGTQFHPEKSQKLGLTLIHNFIQWRP